MFTQKSESTRRAERPVSKEEKLERIEREDESFFTVSGRHKDTNSQVQVCVCEPARDRVLTPRAEQLFYSLIYLKGRLWEVSSQRGGQSLPQIDL